MSDIKELQTEFRHLYKRMVELGERIAIHVSEAPPAEPKRPEPGHSRHIPGDWWPSKLPWLGEISVYRSTVERKGGGALEQCWAIQWTKDSGEKRGNHATFFGPDDEEFAKECVLGILALRAAKRE